MSLSAGIRLGRYEIRAKIGAGGMGEVYLAQDTKLDRKVALKILPAEVAADRNRMERFVREAKAAAALNHPNIAHIYEIGEHDGTNFIAMEHIDGQTLRELIRNHTDLRKLLRLLQHAAEGLAKAHAAGIVHRDLKPENIMVTRDGHAKILDFGLAKLIETKRPSDTSSEVATAILPQPSQPGMVLGTVGYMSPEQAQGRTDEIDQRSDIFSFGCILFEAVTGRKAFEGKDAVESLNKIIREPVSPIRDLNPSAPADLQRVVRRCLAKDMDERYQTLKDVAIELKEVRRELEASGIDTVVPTSMDIQTKELPGATTSTPISMPPASRSQRASSAEYVVTGIKQHKLAGAVTLLFIVIGAAGVGLYLHARNTESAIESIAVLPFDNQSNDPDADYISDGIAESIINSLARLPNLKVIPRSIAFRYKGKPVDPQKTGEELRVNAVLTGRVVQRGDNVTISVELDDIRYGKQLWGEQYNRKPADLLAVQSDIANEVVQRVRWQPTGEQRQKLTKGATENPAAYQLYLKGNFFASKFTKEGLQKGLDYFNQAIAVDPNYALAYTGVGFYYVGANDWYQSPKEAMPKARDAARKALAIDDTLADAHLLLGTVAHWYDWDWATAEREYRRAIELNPNDPRPHEFYSWFLSTNMARADEAIAEAKKAQQLDPVSAETNQFLGGAYFFARRYDEAIDQLRKAAEFDPDYWLAHEFLGQAYEQKGKLPEAIAEFQRAHQIEGTFAEPTAMLGHAYALSGKQSEALKIIDQLKDLSSHSYVPPYNIAAVYAGLGDQDRTIEWLNRAYAERSFYLPWVGVDPHMDALHSDPRFADLVKRVGLPR